MNLNVIIGLSVKQAAFKVQGLGIVARGKIGTGKPAGAIDCASPPVQRGPFILRKIQLQQCPRKEVSGIFPVNAERGQNRPCIAGLAVDTRSRDLTPDAIMNEPAIQCQAAICGPEGKAAAATLSGSILFDEAGQVGLGVDQRRCACRQELSDRAQDGINLANGDGHNYGRAQCHPNGVNKRMPDPRRVILIVGIGNRGYPDLLPSVPVVRIKRQAHLFQHDIFIIGCRLDDDLPTRRFAEPDPIGA